MSKHSPAFLKAVDAAKQSVKEINMTELEQLQQQHPNLIIIDVREDREVDSHPMQGAKHIGKGVIDRDLEHEVTDQNTPLVFVCRSGYRSLIAAKQAQDMGYQNVYSLSGGVIAWCKAKGLEAPVTPFQ